MAVERHVRLLVQRYGLCDAEHLEVLRRLLERAPRLPPNYREHREAYAELLVLQTKGLDGAGWLRDRLSRAGIQPPPLPAGADLPDLYCAAMAGATPPGG